jgi:hypothetical protein
VAALLAWWAGRRALALALNGVALALACAGSVLALALDLAASGRLNANALGLLALALAAALSALCFYSARKPAWQAGAFWFAAAVNAAGVGFLFYLVLFFRIWS